MTTLISAVKRKLSFQKAIARAVTGDTIIVSSAPANIESGERFAHMLGLMSHINDTLYLNNVAICRTDTALTHGTMYLPFYERILIRRSAGIGVYDFFWMLPTDPENPARNTNIVPKPAFRYESDQLETIPLSSGKGIILKSTHPMKIQLLKKLKIIGTTWNVISAKDVDASWEGEHAICFDTPSTLVVGQNISKPGEPPITRFFRGHGRKRVAVYDHPSTDIKDCLATDTDFFYQDKDARNEGSYVSATTGKAYYTGQRGEFFVTTNALVRREGPIVEANGQIVTDSLCTGNWIVPHAHGMLYGWNGEIRMLVIK